MIAITGATGQLGRATLQALLPQVGAPNLVAVVRDPQKAQDLRPLGVQVRPGDYDDPAALAAAFQGIDTVLLVSTSEFDYATRVQQHRNAIDAAKQAGVRHVVYTSIFRPSAASHFGSNRSHAATEAYLLASGLTYTLLRNTLYLDLVPMFVGEGALASGKIYFAAGAGRVSFALREEIAQATAHVLATQGHDNKAYDIAPAPPCSFHGIAAVLGEVTGQAVTYVPIAGEDLAAGMRQHQVPGPVVAMMGELASAIAANEFDASSPDFEQLLGRKPTDLKTYLTAVYGK
ncbi:SDR family oxidoreductase [Hymenobacter sp. PAMC 26628]|uniref:SDR family oxidoreductase n=1 Tax=Hymenobacter sp. PAMC 26628 TaxID=1484118 RepID=UPI0007701122|nr:SDR family oxidoreductase [Hymenobacter sp. PAMC 26628]AMJ67306.1 hypothetical protein AXW84_19175 [Hymenobacter sp. PAMC 26628]